MKTILFQGDSITDVGRWREDPADLGKGYPNLVAGRMGLDCPGEYTFWNRGVSGDRIVDLYARMKADILNLKPDYISILVGVNDVWHELSSENGVSTDRFRRIYAMLIEDIREALPGVKLCLLEPFVADGTATREHLSWFRQEVAARAAVVRELAERYGLLFLPLQAELDRLLKIAPADYWLVDGVHPTVFFHQYIADRWLETFRQVDGK